LTSLGFGAGNGWAQSDSDEENVSENEVNDSSDEQPPKEVEDLESNPMFRNDGPKRERNEHGEYTVKALNIEDPRTLRKQKAREQQEKESESDESSEEEQPEETKAEKKPV